MSHIVDRNAILVALFGVSFDEKTAMDIQSLRDRTIALQSAGFFQSYSSLEIASMCNIDVHCNTSYDITVNTGNVYHNTTHQLSPTTSMETFLKHLHIFLKQLFNALVQSPPEIEAQTLSYLLSLITHTYPITEDTIPTQSAKDESNTSQVMCDVIKCLRLHMQTLLQCICDDINMKYDMLTLLREYMEPNIDRLTNAMEDISILDIEVDKHILNVQTWHNETGHIVNRLFNTVRIKDPNIFSLPSLDPRGFKHLINLFVIMHLAKTHIHKHVESE